MLVDFIMQNRQKIIERTKQKLANRLPARLTPAELEDSPPLFLDQVCDALRLAATSESIDHTAIGRAATQRGGDLERLGLTVGQVVHGYGDVCQAITEVAVEHAEASITPGDFQTLNLCLDDAIAAAVSSFAQRRNVTETQVQTERLGAVAHRLRDLVNTAMISYESLRSGRVGPGGSTGLLLGQTLIALRNLIDSSVAELRLEAGEAQRAPLGVAEFLEEVEVGALVQSTAYAVPLIFRPPADRTLTVSADRQILASALASLLDNAFRCSTRTPVTLTTVATAERVRFEVEDCCGGLATLAADKLARAFEHGGPFPGDSGLATAFRATAANGGKLRLRNTPGSGCVFTIELPRMAPIGRP